MRGRGIGTAVVSRAAGLGVGARRRARILQVDSGQCARGRALPQVRLRDAVHVSLPRAAGRMPMNDSLLEALSAELGSLLVARGWRVTTAESCTGGLVAGAITAIAGSSGWFDQAFVTYSNEAKTRAARRRRRRCSRRTARFRKPRRGRWRRGRWRAPAPTRASRSPASPVLAAARRTSRSGSCASPGRCGAPVTSATSRFAGDRAAVRQASVVAALEGLIERARGMAPRAERNPCATWPACARLRAMHAAAGGSFAEPLTS